MASQVLSVGGHEGLGRIHRKSCRGVHYALLGTAGGENHPREANSGNLSHHASCLHRWPRALVNVRTSPDQLASHARQRGNTCVFARHFSPESALPLMVSELRAGLSPHSHHKLRHLVLPVAE